MGKRMFAAVLTVLFLAGSGSIFAMDGPGDMKKEVDTGEMMPQQREPALEAKMFPQQKMHPGMGMDPSKKKGEMISTGDGGVIIMMGEKLLKYDKDLNFIKEVEINKAPGAIQQKMRQFREECPQYEEKMKKESDEIEKGKQEGPERE